MQSFIQCVICAVLLCLDAATAAPAHVVNPFHPSADIELLKKNLPINFKSIYLPSTMDADAAAVGAGGRRLSSGLTISPGEFDALVDIYESTGGEHWVWSSDQEADGIPWNISGSSDPCVDDWQGVDCVCPVPDMVCVVTQLDLFRKNLTGSIPTSVAALPYLGYLNLVANGLTGRIPPQIALLQGLQYLLLYDNLLSGEIPLEIYGISTLFVLMLGNVVDSNKALRLDTETPSLTGSVPNDIQNLTNLQFFYLFDTRMTGTIPSVMGNMTTLEAIVMSGSLFTGTIPPQIGNLTKLSFLVFGACRYTGTVPSSLQQLTALTVFSLGGNDYSGTIPAKMFSLPSMQLFYVNNNKFSGSIPTSVGELSSLVGLEISSNCLTGTIPTGLSTLSALSLIDMGFNRLTGTIPTIFGSSMPALSFLDLSYNSLDGTLPSEMGGLYSLNHLSVSFNSLSGALPTSLGSLPSINFMSFQHNALSGSLPSSLSQLTTLRFLDVGANRFGGTIPSFFCTDMRGMVSMNMSSNRFYGGVPSCLSLLNESLSFLDLSYNHLGGRVPSTLGHLSLLGFLSLARADLTGSIPSSLARLSDSLVDLKLYGNRLSGTLHSSLCSLRTMSYIDVSRNRLQGTIPGGCFSGWESSEYVFLQNNRFSGQLNDLFRESSTSKLLVLDIGANAFTGELPTELFSSSPLLQTFSAIRNCFYGKIPAGICDATGLVELTLDGLSAADSCQNQIFPMSPAYLLNDQIEGTIPRCLYSLPNIRLLHLSGNGIRDSIPSDVQISGTMVNLVLAHNLMHGEIPRQVQERSWKTLDLSFNKFSGTLVENISRVADGSALFLNVNRISGKVPKSLRSARNLSVLDGNLFSCALYTDDESIPEHDDNAAVYQCADTFTQLSFVWASPFFLSLLAIALILVVLQVKTSAVSNWVKHKIKLWQQWTHMLTKDVTLKTGRTNTVYLLTSFVRDFQRTTFVMSAYIVLVLAPTWLVLSHFYSTYEYLYAWTISSSYLSGRVPGIVMMVGLSGVLVCVFSLYQDNVQKDIRRMTSLFVGGIFIESKKMAAVQTGSLVLLVVLNSAIVFLVNMCYVYVVITYNRVLTTLAALGMAGFNLFWNNVAMVRVLRVMGDCLVPIESASCKAADAATLSGDSAITPLTATQVKFENRAMITSCVLELLNKIAIPCLATAVVSSTCYKSFFIQPRTIETLYQYTVCRLESFLNYSCSVIGGVEACVTVSGASYRCAGEVLVEKGAYYDPPFSYSYQCTAMFVSSYAASYVYMFLVVAFVIPLGASLLLNMRDRFSEGSKWYCSFDDLLPSALKAVKYDFHLKRHRHLFDRSRFVVACVSHTAILVTFGAVFPPLAVVICVAIISKSQFMVLTLGRLLDHAEVKGLVRYRNALIEECQGVAKSVGHQIWLIVPFAALFYSFFIFDTYGDAEGFKEAAIPAGIVAVVIPVLFFVAKRARDVYRRRVLPVKIESTAGDLPLTEATVFLSPSSVAPFAGPELCTFDRDGAGEVSRCSGSSASPFPHQSGFSSMRAENSSFDFDNGSGDFGKGDGGPTEHLQKREASNTALVD